MSRAAGVMRHAVGVGVLTAVAGYLWPVVPAAPVWSAAWSGAVGLLVGVVFELTGVNGLLRRGFDAIAAPVSRWLNAERGRIQRVVPNPPFPPAPPPPAASELIYLSFATSDGYSHRFKVALAPLTGWWVAAVVERDGPSALVGSRADAVSAVCSQLAARIGSERPAGPIIETVQVRDGLWRATWVGVPLITASGATLDEAEGVARALWRAFGVGGSVTQRADDPA